MEQNWKVCRLGPAKCALDLGDGSERGEYVCQDYILQKLGRPHRCINLMYTYYPRDKQWPQRISKACADMSISFQWDFPYDDYFPFDVNGEPFEQMKDVRRHGQDVLLTLTLDCALSDDELRAIARKLKPFGRMRIRINHECQGTWFTHTKRYGYKPVAEFFARFHRIIKEEAPNITTIFCAGFLMPGADGVEMESELLEGYKAADVWSADSYLALHYGWPYDIAEVGGGQYKGGDVDLEYEKFKATWEHLVKVTGQNKPMTSAEFNTDGDVTGPMDQGESVLRFAAAFRDHQADWFKSFSMYQFRDRGRLGLEVEDPNNPDVGIEQPILKDYKRILSDPWYMPTLTEGEDASFPAATRWGGSEDAEGLALEIPLEGKPVFFEVNFEEDTTLMMELNGRWFYKAPHVKTIDLMPAFWEKPMPEGKVTFRVFATPRDGVNPDTGAADWTENYRSVLSKAPTFRIRYVAPDKVK